MTRRVAVLGRPIAHSLSPVLHRAAYVALGLTGWDYTAVDCGPVELPSLLAGLGPEWAGLSLTMPLKQAALPLLDAVSPLAARVGAVNTVLLDDGRRYGDNTDVEGIRAALAELGVPAPPRAVLLGAGGTARAVLPALAAAGAREVRVVSRRPGAAAALAAVEPAIRVIPLPWSDARREIDGAALVVAAVPAGGGDALAAGGWPGRAALVEVLYAPWPTPLAAAALIAGAPVAGGLAVLVGQAVAQVRLMTGLEPPAAVLRAAGERALAAE